MSIVEASQKVQGGQTNELRDGALVGVVGAQYA